MTIENRLNPHNSDILTRGKTIRTLLRELLSYKDSDIQIMCSSNEGETLLHVSSTKKVTECCMLLCKENDLLKNKQNPIKIKTVRSLMRNFLSYKNFDTEVRFSLDQGRTSQSIGLVGKISGNCVLMNLEDDE